MVETFAMLSLLMSRIVLAVIVSGQVRSPALLEYSKPVSDGDLLSIGEIKDHTIHLYQAIFQNTQNTPNSMGEVFVTTLIPDDVTRSCQGRRSCKIKYSARSMGPPAKHDDAHRHTMRLAYFYVPDNGHRKYSTLNICENMYVNVNDYEAGAFINSPNYPKVYPNNMRCETRFTVPNGQSLFLYLRDLELEGHSKFRFWKREPNDYLDVIDPLTRETQIRLFGMKKDVIIHFRPGNATLRFKSDYANSLRSYRGFSVYFYSLPTKPDIANIPRSNQVLDEAMFKALALAVNTTSDPLVIKPRLAFLNYLVAAVAILSAMAAISSFMVFCKNRRTMRYIRADVMEMINYLNVMHPPVGASVGVLVSTNNVNRPMELQDMKSPVVDKCENLYEYVEFPRTVGRQEDQSTIEHPPTYEQIKPEADDDHKPVNDSSPEIKDP